MGLSHWEEVMGMWKQEGPDAERLFPGHSPCQLAPKRLPSSLCAVTAVELFPQVSFGGLQL